MKTEETCSSSKKKEGGREVLSSTQIQISPPLHASIMRLSGEGENAYFIFLEGGDHYCTVKMNGREFQNHEKKIKSKKIESDLFQRQIAFACNNSVIKLAGEKRS